MKHNNYSFTKLFKRELQRFDSCYLYTLFSSAREAHDLVLERQLYKTLSFPLYDYYPLNQLLKMNNVVICFMGAGIIEGAFYEYIHKLQEKVKEL